MMNKGQITDAMRICEAELVKVRQLLKRGAEYEKQLSNHMEALKLIDSYSQDIDKHRQALAEAYQPLLGISMTSILPQAEPRMRKNKYGRKPDVQIIEEVLREIGPKHVTDLVSVVEARGVVLGGKKAKTIQLKDKMTSSKRFHNFGGNLWGLPSQELPTPSNGHQVEQPHLVGHEGSQQSLIRIG